MAERNPSGRERSDEWVRETSPAGAGEVAQQARGATSASRQGTDVGRAERERPLSTAREETRRRGTALTRLDELSPLAPWGPMTSPFTMMRRMIDDMDRLFENFGFGRTGLVGPSRAAALSPWSIFDDLQPTSRLALWSPPLEILERDKELVVRAELPGISKEDVTVEVDDNVLTISGERRHDEEESREGYYRSERRYGAFSRSIPLPEGVDAKQCQATFRDGVLEITMPKPESESSRQRRIDIR